MARSLWKQLPQDQPTVGTTYWVRFPFPSTPFQAVWLNDGTDAGWAPVDLPGGIPWFLAIDWRPL